MIEHLVEHARLVTALHGGGREELNAYTAFLDRETVFQKLYREAVGDEDTYQWYKERDCEIKGYQWHQASQRKYLDLVIYALGTIMGFSMGEIEKQIRDSYLAWERIQDRPPPVTLKPAYGRNYANKRDLLRAWKENKDFDVVGGKGMKANRQDFLELPLWKRPVYAKFLYAKLTKVHVLEFGDDGEVP